MSDDRPRARPCPTCPYRRDVPSGVWTRHEYEKLPFYDLPTGDQAVAGAFAPFYCHQRTGDLCAGWVGCHDMTENLAVRLRHRHLDMDAVLSYVSPVSLFASGAEACAHGLRDVDRPGPEALAVMMKLLHIREARDAV